jgi:hypothetical protein
VKAKQTQHVGDDLGGKLSSSDVRQAPVLESMILPELVITRRSAPPCMTAVP